MPERDVLVNGVLHEERDSTDERRDGEHGCVQDRESKGVDRIGEPLVEAEGRGVQEVACVELGASHAAEEVVCEHVEEAEEGEEVWDDDIGELHEERDVRQASRREPAGARP